MRWLEGIAVSYALVAAVVVGIRVGDWLGPEPRDLTTVAMAPVPAPVPAMTGTPTPAAQPPMQWGALLPPPDFSWIREGCTVQKRWWESTWRESVAAVSKAITAINVPSAETTVVPSPKPVVSAPSPAVAANASPGQSPPAHATVRWHELPELDEYGYPLPPEQRARTGLGNGMGIYGTPDRSWASHIDMNPYGGGFRSNYDFRNQQRRR